MQILLANWNAPKNIKALTTTKYDGVSEGNFSTNNFGLHVNDNPKHVLTNRLNLQSHFKLPNEPIWLNQTHSNNCVLIENELQNCDADAAITRNKNFPLVIMTADCVPILICDKNGTEIAAIHAGWRGLINGIIENTFQKTLNDASEYMAWIGPAICQNCYTVGEEVYEQFINKYPFSKQAFLHNNLGTQANLPLIAELILNMLGVSMVSQSMVCTFESSNQFYSYRKNAKTGRMATLIWFEDR